MELVSSIIHRYWKLVVALSIPVFVAWGFIHAQEEAKKLIDQYQRDQKADPTAENLYIKNYEMKEVDGQNHTRWHLKADGGKAIGDTNQQVALEGVTMDYLDQDTQAVKMRLMAPAGEANQMTKYVKLISQGKNRVEAKGQ